MVTGTSKHMPMTIVSSSKPIKTIYRCFHSFISRLSHLVTKWELQQVLLIYHTSANADDQEAITLYLIFSSTCYQTILISSGHIYHKTVFVKIVSKFGLLKC